MVHNNKVYVGGYGYQYRELVGEDIHHLTMIANAVDNALEDTVEDLKYLTTDHLNTLALKVANRILENCDLKTIEKHLRSELMGLVEKGYTPKQVAECRIAGFDDDEVALGLRVWAKYIIMDFDNQYHNIIEKGLDLI